MRIVGAVFLLISCVAGISALFWQQEYQYSLPTPQPAGYVPTLISSKLDVQGLIAGYPVNEKVMLNFFNPDCPCSRFNSKHVAELFRQYGDKIRFFVVVPEGQDLQKVRRLIGEDVSIIEDRGNFIAQQSGVYSTPQAVMISPDKKLYYRGNYNRNRYCTRPESNFAELALKAFLNFEPLPNFSAEAYTAYGCEISYTPTL